MYKRVPRELKELPQWVCWRLVEDPDRPGKKKKIPIDPGTGGPARSNDPATWAAYEDAVEGQDRFRADGIGIMFANGIFGIDLDHCLDEGGQLLPFAREILDTVQSYAELSPSGTGIHILCAGGGAMWRCTPRGGSSLLPATRSGRSMSFPTAPIG